MKTSVCKELNKSECSIDDILLYLRIAKTDPNVLKGVSNFPELFNSLEEHGCMNKADPSWLKDIARHAKCSKALEIIEKYSLLLVADKTMWGHDKLNENDKYLAAEFSNKTPDNCTINDGSNAKSNLSKIHSIKETDSTLHSSEVGSLTLYWKVKDNVTITFPKILDSSLAKKFKDAGISRIGTVIDGKLELISIAKLENGEFIDYHNCCTMQTSYNLNIHIYNMYACIYHFTCLRVVHMYICSPHLETHHYHYVP